MGAFLRKTSSHKMRLTPFLGLSCLFFMIKQGEATIGITVASGGATVLALTATQVTALAAIKALAATNGVLLGAIASRRGRRQADERLNIVDFGSGTGKEPQIDLVSILSSNEAQQCTQFLFCSAAGDSNIKLAQDVESLRETVISLPGKYKTADKIGQQSGGEDCRAYFECSLSLEDIVTFINSL